VWQTGSYSNAIDNFKVEKSAIKSPQNLRRIQEMMNRICELHEKNLHFCVAQNSDNPR